MIVPNSVKMQKKYYLVVSDIKADNGFDYAWMVRNFFHPANKVFSYLKKEKSGWDVDLADKTGRNLVLNLDFVKDDLMRLQEEILAIKKRMQEEYSELAEIICIKPDIMRKDSCWSDVLINNRQFFLRDEIGKKLLEIARATNQRIFLLIVSIIVDGEKNSYSMDDIVDFRVCANRIFSHKTE